MNFEIVVATTNKHKMKEYREILSPFGITLYSFSDLNISLPDVEENGTNYEENALIKVNACKDIVKFPVLSDDSGLEVESLDNKPGLNTARFAKECGGQILANRKIVETCSKENRNAKFKCVISLANLSEKPLIFEGVCEGKITDKYNDEESFGYDPIFVENTTNELFSKIEGKTKNKLSHRGKACKKLITYLKIMGYIR